MYSFKFISPDLFTLENAINPFNNFRRKWEEYHPKTNVLWLKHIIENLLRMVQRKNSSMSEKEEFAKMSLRIYSRVCLSYPSATDFVRDLILKQSIN